MCAVSPALACLLQGDTPMSQQWSAEANSLFKRGVGLLPRDILLHFAYADYLEQHSRVDEAKQLYEALLAQPDIDPTLVYIQYMKVRCFSRDACRLEAGYTQGHGAI
jgi:cleavage stimulation factor subunit 3